MSHSIRTLMGVLRSAAVLATALALSGVFTHSDAEAASEKEAALILRALTYLRDFEERTGNEIVLGVVYPSQDQTQGPAWVAVFEGLTDISIADRSLFVVGAEIDETTDLASLAQELHFDFVFFAGDFDDSLDALLVSLQEHGILTACASAPAVKRGVVLGIDTADSDVKLFVNLPAANAVGATFDARLLSLVTIYR